MDRKNRIYIILTGVVAIVLVWLSQGNGNRVSELQLPLGEELTNNVSTEKVGSLEGILWSSDDEEKGNLMLASNNTMIYVRTTRDFSNLIGKHVIASIDGVLENFTLLNIEESLAREGYIKAE